MCSPDIPRLAALVLVLGGLLPALLVSGNAQAATVGTLTQLATPAGCVVDGSAPIAGCTSGRAMRGIAPFFGSHAVAISPDGKNLYAAAFNSDRVVAFERSAHTGKLVERTGATGRGMLKPTSVAVSRDGRSVYVASIVASSIAVFDRNTKTGSLKQKSGSAGCVSKTAEFGCAVGRAMEGVDVVVVSPGGGNVYAGSFISNAIVSFDRSASGAIRQKSGGAGCTVDTATGGCRTGRALKGAEGMTVSPDGRDIYVGAAVGNAVAVFHRSSSTGELSQPSGTAGCVAHQGADGCASGDGLVGADSMQVSPDNKNLYVASGVGSSVAIFKRNTKSGRLSQLAGVAGCFTDRKRDLGRCNTGIEIDQPEGIAVSPDGNTVYVGSFASSSITVFDRTAFSGTITQRVGANGCIVNVATSGCTTGLALGNANALVVSRDGANVYAGSFASNAVNAFARAQPPTGHTSVSIPSRIGVTSTADVDVKVSCAGSKLKRCPGGLTLRALSTTIGRGAFNIPGGQHSNVTVALSYAARQYLRTNISLPATATLRVVQPSGELRTTRQNIVLFVSGLG
ncbi:MAG: lactonase family protein [Solirubrobacterales bacterium]